LVQRGWAFWGSILHGPTRPSPVQAMSRAALAAWRASQPADIDSFENDWIADE
jgi:hypothetical protein